MLDCILPSSTTVSLLGTVVGLLLVRFFYINFTLQPNRREPPGPWRLPLLGNLLQLDLKRLDMALLNLSRVFGPVFTVYFGFKKVVVLAGHQTVRQALVGHAEEFGEREVLPIFHDATGGHGIIFTNGATWKEMRGFAFNALRDFGLSGQVSEGKITEECRYLIEAFEQHGGQAFNYSKTLKCATSNIISAILFGTRFQYNNPVFQALLDRVHETFYLLGSTSILIYNLFPWLGPWLKSWRTLMEHVEDSKRDVSSLIAELKKTLDPSRRRCFVDAFQMRRQDRESQIKDSPFHDENLLHSAINLFAAGSQTTATTLQWCLLFMAKYPDIQDQVQEELSRVVGARQVRLDDRRRLPYTDAVVHESQRFASVFPMALPRRTSRDVTFQGCFIEGGTTVFPLLTSVLRDGSEWERPDTFDPSRFLSEGGEFVRRDAFMPFSAGRRVCLGEGLARMELFLFFASLLQRFRFTPPPGVSAGELDLTPVVGLQLAPACDRLCAVSRRR